jgi:hypothetical protein
MSQRTLLFVCLHGAGMSRLGSESPASAPAD